MMISIKKSINICLEGSYKNVDMKKLLLFLIVIHQLYGFGQNSPCVNEVSTNPENPTNSNLPNETVTDYDLRFLNEFNWIPFNGAGNLGDLQTVGFPYLGTNQYMFPLYNVPTGNSQFYTYLNNELIMPTNGQGGFLPDHQNGWELLAVNLGFFPDGSPYTDVSGATNKHPRIPYVILYHRYLSKIRVFANIGDEWATNNAYDAVRIRLTLNNENGFEKNGLFRLQEGTDQTLDQTTDILSVGALAEAPNDKQRWFSADFTVAYDACVCDFASAINLDFELVKNIDFKLYGRGISTEEDIVNADGDFVQDDFLSGFSVDQVNEEENGGGFVMYKKMEDLFDDYISRMESYQTELANVQQHNETIDRNLAIVKWVRHAVDVGVAAATGGGGSLSVSLTNDLLQYASGIVGSNVSSSELSDRWEAVFKEAEKILGKEITTFVNDNFKKKDPPTVPEKPTVTFSEMYFDGRLTQNDPKNGPTIYTPGTYGNSITNDLPDQHFYPVYNEALGVFALLRKPTIKTYSNSEVDDCFSVGFGGGNQQGGDHNTSQQVTLNYFNTLQWTLENKLEYIINPVLDVKDIEILAAIEVEGINELSETFFPDSADHKFLINAESISMEFEEGVNHVQKLVDTIVATSKYFPLDAFQNITSQMTYRVKRKTAAQGQTPSELICESMLGNFKVTGGKLRLIVNITYEGEKSNGSPHDYTYMYSYNIDPSDIDETSTSPLFPNLPGSSGDITQYPENLFLDGENFDGSAVDGCELNGTIYTCKAWNNITVEGDFTVSPGYFVKVEAGNEVNIVAESNTPPEMQFSILPVLDFSNPMPPQDQTAVEAFCLDNNSYQANISTKSSKSSRDNEVSTKSMGTNSVASNFEFKLYPNPTNGQTNASIVLENDAEASLIVTDLSGKKLIHELNNELLNKGDNKLVLDSHSLAPGIYLVHLTVNGKKYVKRLVKQ